MSGSPKQVSAIPIELAQAFCKAATAKNQAAQVSLIEQGLQLVKAQNNGSVSVTKKVGKKSRTRRSKAGKKSRARRSKGGKKSRARRH